MEETDIDASNLTGGQIQEALDFLIYKALEPLVRFSTVFDVQLAHLLGIAATNKKRKISALERQDFITRLCNALVTTNVDRKFEYISTAKIERSFVLTFLTQFLAQTSDYVDLYTQYLSCASHKDRQVLDRKLTVIERSTGFSRDHLFPACNTCKHYVDLAYEFRNKIVVQYLKHGYKQAHAFCKLKGKNFDFQDVYQSLMAAITKALDKYDSSKGALTSYINWWILNAQTYAGASYGHEYGIAYTIPQLHRKNVQGKEAAEVNFSVSLESVVRDSDADGVELVDLLVGSEGTDKEFEARDELDTLLYLIKAADIRGMARLYLDLDEYISDKEKVRMLKSMKKQLDFVPAVEQRLLQKL